MAVEHDQGRPITLQAAYINPFLRAVKELVNVMLGGTVRRGSPGLSGGEHASGHIMALIDITGALRGTVAMSMPHDTALAMCGALLMETVEDIDEEIIDALQELVNIMAGSAKAGLSEEAGSVLSLSLPIVVRGANYTVETPSRAIWLDVPFDSSFGPFMVRISFER